MPTINKKQLFLKTDRILYLLIVTSYKGIEFVGDYRLTKNIFWLLKSEMKTKPLMMTDSILQQGLVSKGRF
jgi:hypothetical protein